MSTTSTMNDNAVTIDGPFTPSLWRAAIVLAKREIVRFFRQPNRVIGGLGQPLLFWLLFSVGLNRSFNIPDQDFGQYYIPGTLVLILLFTAIFSTISIIEDRREGFLQSVLVAPVSRWAMVLGKVLGGACIAWLQSLIFLALALTYSGEANIGRTIQVTILLALAGLAFTALGFVIAWRLESTQGFHAIMNLLLLPMWLLSGAFFPIPSTATGGTIAEHTMHWLMRLNPVTYVVGGIRHLLASDGVADISHVSQFWLPRLAMCWVVSLAFAVVMFGAAWQTSKQRTSGDLL